MKDRFTVLLDSKGRLAFTNDRYGCMKPGEVSLNVTVKSNYTMGKTIEANQYISDPADSASIWHPDTRIILKLLNEELDIMSYRIFGRFGSGPLDSGWEKSITVRQFLSLPEIPEYYFHGTSLEDAKVILRKGLKPRSITKKEAVFGVETPSNPRYVYLTAETGVADAAAEAADPFSHQAILMITIPKVSKLRPDEDCRCETWQESLAIVGGVAYEGSISPKYINLLLVRPRIRVAWKKPSKRLLQRIMVYSGIG